MNALPAPTESTTERARFAARRKTYVQPWHSILRWPGFVVTAWQWDHNGRGVFETRDYDQAVQAAKGYLFTGAESVMVQWLDGDNAVTEWWEAA